MEFLELVHLLDVRIVDSSEFTDFYSYKEDGLVHLKLGTKYSSFPMISQWRVSELLTNTFCSTRTFIPLWRYVIINDCDPDNWRDMFPTQQFFLTPAEDIDPDIIEKIYSQIFETHPELVAVLAVETSSEGF